ncbi:hypothetical protein LTS02_008756 [Friedmanniomyces endolithicus]|nr:hypothetical protein LTR59_001498 [Friedmanniomyces endolithicus]KAK0860096.1 hypothetical protein LTS02_008756 [Friedmanniomyces endolithicus]KAK0867347.1 hypothetical protein LTR87_014629 [Friedmanniomyces endolithicus]KAK1082610.1 hypothetical protein LTR33_003804 [Friedmanniomyces endolithicus]
MAQGLRHAHVTLLRRIIRLFLAEIIRALRSQMLPGVGIGKPPVGDEDDPPSELARFVLALARQLGRLLDTFHTTLSRLQDFYGTHTVEHTPPEIWAAFGDRPDKTEAKNMVAHMHR